MNIDSIAISGFRSFRGLQTLDLPKGNGLYLMSGENRVETELGANGAGKSSVWDALCWVLYGQTSRRIRGPSVQNQDSKTCGVVATGMFGNSYCSITRTRKPNSLTIGDKVVDQDEVDALVGMNADVFRSCVLMGQFSRFFFDLSPTEKLDLFSRILDLDVWVKASKRASTAVKKCDDQIRELEKKQAAADARLKIAEDRVAELKVEIAGTKSNRESDIRRLKADLTARKSAISGLKDAIPRATRTVNKIQRETDALTKRANDLDVELRQMRREVPQRRREYVKLETELAELERRQAAIEDDACPVCGQAIPKTKKARTLKTIKTRLDQVAAAMKDLDVESDQRRLDSKEAEAVEVAKLEREARDRLDKAKSEAREYKDNHDATVRDRDRILDAIDRLETSAQRDRDALKTAKTHRDNEATRVKEIVDELRDEREALDALSFWPKGFKDVRLWIIEQALLDLQVATNNSLAELGMPEWSVTFDVERETKAGTVSRGFTVLIHPPSGDPLPWESWSGGETQRLRIAGAAALADMIAARTGTSSKLEVWDEPTAHLSEEGVDDLLRWFRERAASRQVWLVDHRSLDAGAFAGEVRIVKETDGSRIESF